ncbi:MAG: cutinase family protein, partial [Candidatus Saccharibacteria bacterium]|nr:cutinase family protein [Candidatus Saccharibacteria bacterium]
QFVLAGYSQGAMVISRVLNELDSEKIIYAATFGDPKLYLPEGEGFYPDACRNKNLSDYRKYVPDCHAFEGLLGSYRPYEPEKFIGKLGTWCNKQDIMCSSAFNIGDHVSYVDDGLYDDASKIIFDKISKTFSFKNTVTSPHDTAILIDSTGSMSGMIEKYKSEAIRLATETLNNDGRVALYDYRDLADPYEPHEHCNFETCNLDLIKSELEKIEVHGGGDIKESLLSASLHVMNKLSWKYGATKSVIVLTDSSFHTPDLDGTTLLDVVKLSQSIDPVNFYIITNPESAPSYKELAEQTDGKIETDFNKLSLLTDLVMNRYDSLPRVEPEDEPTEPATLRINSYIFRETLTVNFETNAEKVLVVLNDLPLGLTTDKKIEITDLNIHQENTLRLIPIKSNRRGQAAELNLDLIPSVPNTGTASILTF